MKEEKTTKKYQPRKRRKGTVSSKQRKRIIRVRVQNAAALQDHGGIAMGAFGKPKHPPLPKKKIAERVVTGAYGMFACEQSIVKRNANKEASNV